MGRIVIFIHSRWGFLTQTRRAPLSSNRCSAFRLKAGRCFHYAWESRKIHNCLRCFCLFCRWFIYFRYCTFNMTVFWKTECSLNRNPQTNSFKVSKSATLTQSIERAEMTWTQHRRARALCWRAVAWGNSWWFQSANISDLTGIKVGISLETDEERSSSSPCCSLGRPRELSSRRSHFYPALVNWRAS